MGYEVYESKNNWRWQGHGVPAVCDHPDCNVLVDRGMGYACCDDPKHTNSCGGFFCSTHAELCTPIYEDEFEDLEKDEVKELLSEYDLTEMPTFDQSGVFFQCGHEPIQYKEHRSWLSFILEDESWEKWRGRNPEAVALYAELLGQCNEHGYAVIDPKKLVQLNKMFD